MGIWVWTAWGDQAADVFDIARVRHVTNDISGTRRPFGGLWLAAVEKSEPTLRTAWIDWCERFGEPVGRSWRIELDPSAKVLKLETATDLHSFIAVYGEDHPQADGTLTEPAVRWGNLANTYDAIYMSAAADAATRELCRPWGRSYGWWEVPALLVLTPSVIASASEQVN